MLDAMTSVLDELEEPSSFVECLNNLPTRRHSSVKYDGTLDATRFSDSVGPAERLASSVYLCEIISRKKLEDANVKVEGGLKYSCLFKLVFYLISKFI